MSCLFCPNLKERRTVEDSQNDVRQLEHSALDAVLHAFRAQGPLDLYKEVLLDHLKTSLFISTEDYTFKVDHVATDPTLKHICDTLNPSYANSNASWLLERQSILPNDYRLHMDRLGTDITDIFDSSRITDDQWTQMYQDYETEKKNSLAKLLTLKKEPFTPELLREILVRTEQSNRIDYKTSNTSTQTCNNESNVAESTNISVEKVNVAIQTINEQPTSSDTIVQRIDVGCQATEEQTVENTPEPMNTSPVQNQMNSEPSTSSNIDTPRSRVTSSSSTSNPADIVSTLISNISSGELESFNKFMKKKIPTLKPARKKVDRLINLKTRYNLLRQVSQQPETQINRVTNERSHSLS